MNQTKSYLALDVGERRIGVATAEVPPGIAIPYGTIEVDGSEVEAVVTIAKERRAECIVIGYPRNQSGEATAQSKVSEAFAEQLERCELPTVFQDESLTSVMAEQRLSRRAKSYAKGEIDAEAATIILQDYLEKNR